MVFPTTEYHQAHQNCLSENISELKKNKLKFKDIIQDENSSLEDLMTSSPAFLSLKAP